MTIKVEMCFSLLRCAMCMVCVSVSVLLECNCARVQPKAEFYVFYCHKVSKLYRSGVLLKAIKNDS